MTKQTKKQVKLTKEGLEELQTELNELVKIKLPAIITRVAIAREHGDLSENAEYHSARDDQQLLQARIDELQEVIDNAVIIKHAKNNLKVGIGSVVKISKIKSKKQQTFNIVGEFETDPVQGKISSASPIGSALMGKKKGDSVTVKAPIGDIKYKILEIK